MKKLFDAKSLPSGRGFDFFSKAKKANPLFRRGKKGAPKKFQNKGGNFSF